MIPWEQIESNQKFQSLSEQDQTAVKLGWFKENIGESDKFQSLSEQDQLTVANGFFGKETTEKNPEFSFSRLVSQGGRSALQGLADVSHGMRGFEDNVIDKTPVELNPQGELAKMRQRADQSSQADPYRINREQAVSTIKPLEQHAPERLEGTPEGFSGMVEQAVEGMSRFAPSMVTSAVNPVAGLGATFTQLYGMKRDQYLKEGIDKEHADNAALISAIGQTPVEFAGNLLQIGALKNVIKGIGKPALKRLATFGQALVAGTAGEGMEEYLQAYPEEIADIYARNPKDTPEQLAVKVKNSVLSGEFQGKAVEQAKIGALGGFLLAGSGGIVGETANLVKSKKQQTEEVQEKEHPLVSKIKTDLESGKIDSDKVTEIANNPKIQEAGLAEQVLSLIPKQEPVQGDVQEPASIQPNTELTNQEQPKIQTDTSKLEVKVSQLPDRSVPPDMRFAKQKRKNHFEKNQEIIDRFQAEGRDVGPTPPVVENIESPQSDLNLDGYSASEFTEIPDSNIITDTGKPSNIIIPNSGKSKQQAIQDYLQLKRDADEAAERADAAKKNAEAILKRGEVESIPKPISSPIVDRVYGDKKKSVGRDIDYSKMERVGNWYDGQDQLSEQAPIEDIQVQEVAEKEQPEGLNIPQNSAIKKPVTSEQGPGNIPTTENLDSPKGGDILDGESWVDKAETGKPISFQYYHNKEKAPDMGSQFGQDIEPDGKYLGAHTKNINPLPNYEYGVAKFNNPLVIEHETTGHGGWKTKLSEKYNGKVGKELSTAIKKDGHDGIITVDSKAGYVQEIVSLDEKTTSFPNPTSQPGKVDIDSSTPAPVKQQSNKTIEEKQEVKQSVATSEQVESIKPQTSEPQSQEKSVVATEAKPTKKEKALQQYTEYIESLSAEERENASEFIIDNPTRPASQRGKIKRFLEKVEAYQEKKQNRIDRMKARASKAEQRSNEAYKRADASESATGIPMGQPILVGHHSEKRHRATLKKLDNAMRKSVEESKKADYYRDKAEVAANNNAISSDDPLAVKKLKEKIAGLEKDHQRMKDINKIVRKKPKNQKTPEKIEQLKNLFPKSKPETLEKFFEPDFAGRIGIPSYSLTNNNANIRRNKQRLAQLQKQTNDETTEIEHNGIKIVDNVDENRLQIFFDGKPDADVRKQLKTSGFRWARSKGAWQRHRSRQAMWRAKDIVGIKDEPTAPGSGTSKVAAKDFDVSLNNIKNNLKSERGSFSVEDANGNINQDLLTVGKYIIQQGADKFRAFRIQLRKTFGDLFKKISKFTRKIFESAKSVLNNEIGSIGSDIIADQTTVDEYSEEAINEYVKENPSKKEKIEKLEKEFGAKFLQDFIDADANWKGRKNDLSPLNTLISTPIHHWTELDKDGNPKIEALYRMVKHGLESQTNFYEAVYELTHSAENESLFEAGESLKKIKPEEYEAIRLYTHYRDLWRFGYKIKQDGDFWVLNNPEGKKVQSFETEDAAKAEQDIREINDFQSGKMWEGEAELAKEVLSKEEYKIFSNYKPSDLGVKWLTNIRVLTDRYYEAYLAPLRNMLEQKIQTAKDRGFEVKKNDEGKYIPYLKKKPIPGAGYGTEVAAWDSVAGHEPIVYEDENGKKTQINFRQLLAEMGDLRGSYMPRIRQSGRLVMMVTKKGEHPIAMNFDLGVYNKNKKLWKSIINAPLPIQIEARKLRRKGYKIEIKENEKIPEDLWEMLAPIIANISLINKSLEETGTITGVSALKDMGMTTKWEKNKEGKDDFVLEGPVFNQGYDFALKDLGGEYTYKQMFGHSGTPQWRFENADSNIEDKISQRIFEIKNINPNLEQKFAEQLGRKLTDYIKGRGSRSHMIARSDKLGKEVWLGYEPDPLTALGTMGHQIAGGLAKNKLATDLMEDFTGSWEKYSEFKERMGQDNKTVKWQDYQDLRRERSIEPKQKTAFREGKTYIQDMLRNAEPTDRVLGALKGAAVFKFLAFRVFSAPVINLTALPTSTVATMKGYGKIPIRKTGRLLARGGKDYVNYRRGIMKEKLDSLKKGSVEYKKLKSKFDLFQEMEQKGLYAPQYDREALGFLRSKFGGIYEKVINVGMYTFAASESFNRAATIAGSYYGIREQGVGHEKALELAQKVSMLLKH